MIKLVKGIKELLNFIRSLFGIVTNIFKIIGLAFQYMITIVNVAVTTIATLPTWLTAFATITLGVSIIYFIIGRNTGKSD